ncbi:universal stress protein [Nocardioides pyridinolyticus]
MVAAVSGSPDSERAVDWAAQWAWSVGRPLTLVHAADGIEVHPNTEEFLAAERAATEKAKEFLDVAAQRVTSVHPELRVSVVVEIGDPPAVILDHAQHAAAVVVGSRRDNTRRALLGSVNHAVARHAACPVIVVKEPPSEGALGRRIVVGVDGTSASRPAAEFAFQYAATADLPVVLMHCSWERLARGSAVLGLLSGSEEHGPTEDEELSIAETIAGLSEQYPDVEHRIKHRSTDPATALIDASQSAQLVVVGVRHRNPVAAVLQRSVSTAVAEHAHCPVAVVNTP